MLKKFISNIIEKSLDNYLKNLNINIENNNIEIGYSADDKFGDYASPIGMRLAKILKKNPMEIAEGIINNIENNKYFDKIEVAKPGFINMTLSKEFINEKINDLLKNENYGKNIINENEKKKILIEYISANPTGPLHIGHGRWAAIGSALSNMLKFVGHEVYQEFYVNDAGEQIAK